MFLQDILSEKQKKDNFSRATVGENSWDLLILGIHIIHTMEFTWKCLQLCGFICLQRYCCVKSSKGFYHLRKIRGASESNSNNSFYTALEECKA